MTKNITSKITMNNTQDDFLMQLVDLYKRGTISKKNFLKQIDETNKAPSVKQVKNLQKTVRAKSTRGYNKARKVAANASQNIHKNVAEGTLVIEKLNMHFDMQEINALQSKIKEQAKKTFDKADKLIEKLDKIYPNQQVLELPKIPLNLGKEKRKLGLVEGLERTTQER